jgi:hypothetical protein
VPFEYAAELLALAARCREQRPLREAGGVPFERAAELLALAMPVLSSSDRRARLVERRSISRRRFRR